MKLLISEVGDRSLRDFAQSVNGTIEHESLKVTIRTLHLSIIFSQPEQFSRLINCEFWFSPDVCFLYEDIREALLKCSNADVERPSRELQIGNEIDRNDEYISDVAKFSKAHWAEIVEVPPRWYEKAVEISDRSLRTHFPQIADEDLRNKIRLLEFWRNQ
jgi:hypothetical protein